MEPILAARRKKFNKIIPVGLLAAGHTTAMCLIIVAREQKAKTIAAAKLKSSQNQFKYANALNELATHGDKIIKTDKDLAKIAADAENDVRQKRRKLIICQRTFSDLRGAFFTSLEFSVRECTINKAYNRAYRQNIR